MSEQQEGRLWKIAKEIIGAIVILSVVTCGVCTCAGGKACAEAHERAEERAADGP